MKKDEVIARLNLLADKEKVNFKKEKFAIEAPNSLGVYQADLKLLAKEIGMNSDLGIELFETGLYEAQLICSKTFRPKDLTIDLAERWVAVFDNWEICDSFSMGVFAKSPLAKTQIERWKDRVPEFERRASFATMAGYGLADKKAENDVFEAFFPWIISAATDERNFVKKSVNWALRTIGKRNVDLRDKAIEVSIQLLDMDSKSATWIAKDALRELQQFGVKMQDHPRWMYRP